jgi:hypothetical protein
MTWWRELFAHQGFRLTPTPVTMWLGILRGVPSQIVVVAT